MTYIVGIDPARLPTPAELALDSSLPRTPAHGTPPPVDRADFTADTESCVCCGAPPNETCHPGCDVTYPF